MYRLAFLFLIASAAIAQESPLFPRVSVTGGRYAGRFTTDVRLDPDATGGGDSRRLRARPRARAVREPAALRRRVASARAARARRLVLLVVAPRLRADRPRAHVPQQRLSRQRPRDHRLRPESLD